MMVYASDLDDEDFSAIYSYSTDIFRERREAAVLTENAVPVITGIFYNPGNQHSRRRRILNALSPSISPWQPSDVPQRISFAEDFHFRLSMANGPGHFHMSERALVCRELDDIEREISYRIPKHRQHPKLGGYFLSAFQDWASSYFYDMYKNNEELCNKLCKRKCDSIDVVITCVRLHNTPWSNIDGVLDKVMNVYHHIVSLTNKRHGLVKFGETDFKEKYFMDELLRQFEDVYDNMESISSTSGDSNPTMMEWKKKIFELYIIPFV